MQRAHPGLIRSGQSLSHINVVDLRQNMNINSDGSLISPPSHSAGQEARIAGGRGSNNRVTVDLLTSLLSLSSLLSPLLIVSHISHLTMSEVFNTPHSNSNPAN